MVPKDVACKCRGVKGCVDLKALSYFHVCSDRFVFFRVEQPTTETGRAEWCGGGGGGGRL